LSRTELLLLLALAGCKDKLSWNAHAITQIAEGPFKFQVPPPWRDLTESADPGLARLPRRADATAHIIVRENDSNTDSNIAFMWTDTSRSVTCEALMLTIDRLSGGNVDRSSLRSETMGGDLACTFRSTDEDSDVTTWLRIHGDHMLTLACLRPHKGDSNLDQWCQHYADELRAQSAQ
jgi:hypothetical protein